MVKIDSVPPTVSAIYAQYEHDAEDWRRDHLGASMIGRECWRMLWYSFRWAVKPEHSGRLLRLFETGHIEETRVTRNLRAIGIEIKAEVSHMLLAPHFGGTPDAVGLGFPEAPKSWHVVEYKTASRKAFSELVSKGVRKAKPEHFAQMQIYMKGRGLERAAYLCVCKDDDSLHFERIVYDKEFADSLVAKATAIINAPEPPEKISQDPAWYQCKFCDQRGICHKDDVGTLERNCRTCLSSTPMPNGAWHCDHWAREIAPAEQRAGCSAHLFIPKLVGTPTVVDGDGRSITYATPTGGSIVDHDGKLSYVEKL